MNKAFLAMALAAMPAAGNAQFSLKPMVGATLTNVTCTGKTYKVGVAAGLETEMPVAKRLSVALGAYYSKQGGREIDVDMNLHYVNFPLTANYYIVKGLAVKTGIQFGVNVVSEYKWQGYRVSNVTDYFRDFVFDIPVGLSYEYRHFVADARYNLGITRVGKSDSVHAKDGYNSVFMLTLGYKFTF